MRADASVGIGSGHVLRCRSLARALRTLGAEVRFCCRVPEGAFRQMIADEFPLLNLPLSGDQSLNPAQGIWLPVSEAADATLMVEKFQQVDGWKPDWIVVDHYGLSAIWHQQLRAVWPTVRIAVVDDLADRRHDPDLLVDHNTFGENLAARYEKLLVSDRDVSLCLGPQFALIDPFYAGFQGAVPPRGQLLRLLISLGGAGDSQLLKQILSALSALPVQIPEIHLVQGSFATECSEIQALCDQMGVQQIPAQSSLAPLMVASDLSIGAGGTTTWERLCLGLPSITYALAPNQEAYSKVLSEQSLIEYMGRAVAFNPQKLQQVIGHMQNYPESLRRQSVNGMKLVDGEGCARVARLMAAAMDPELWPQSSFFESKVQVWRWPDGLKLKVFIDKSASLPGQQTVRPGPLRLVDRLQINRRLSKSSKEFLVSSRTDGTVSRAVQRVTVVSSPGSWMNQYIPAFLDQARRLGCSLRWIHNHQNLHPGDVCFLLSYGRLIAEKWIALHRHNLVVHASALPHGKGWSPMSWQILEGVDTIPLTLFEAVADLDAGMIHAHGEIRLRGNELAVEWQQLQADATIRLCIQWLKDYPDNVDKAMPQQGEESFYGRRRPEDSRLDPTLSLQEQFPLLRVVDNEAYPAFFDLKGRRYFLHIKPSVSKHHYD